MTGLNRRDAMKTAIVTLGAACISSGASLEEIPDTGKPPLAIVCYYPENISMAEYEALSEAMRSFAEIFEAANVQIPLWLLPRKCQIELIPADSQIESWDKSSLITTEEALRKLQS